MNTSLNTARPGVPTSTRAPWSSTVTTAASGDTEDSVAAGSDDSDTKGTNDKVSTETGSTNWPKRARRRQSCTCWGRQLWRRATSVTIAPGSSGNPCLQIVWPALSTCASIHFDTWGRSYYVVRMVANCEHPCRR